MGWVSGSGPEGLTAGVNLPPIAASGGSVVVPDAQLLFTADYTRAGVDLLLTGAGGTTLVIENYFALDAAPILFSPEGAMMSPHLVATLVASQTPRQFAQVGEVDTEPPIGEVQDFVGTAAVIRDGVPVTLVIGDPVFRNDVLQTGLESELAIGFADGTIFTLAANARITLDGMIYNPAGTENSLVLSIVQGTFSFITGEIAPTGEMLINTPVATIGIRGTFGLCKLASALGPLSCTVSRTGGGSTDDVTYEDPLTGLVIANLNNPIGVFQIASLGAPVTERPASSQEQANFQTQSNSLFNAQVNIQLDNIDAEQPIDLPAADSNQSGDAGDTGADGDEAPLETAAPPDPGSSPAQSGGIGSFDEPEFVETETSGEPVVTSSSPAIQTTSPPPSASNAPVVSDPEITPDTQDEPPPPPANASPAAGADTAVTSEDTAVVIPVLANDSDPESDALAVSAVTQGANGGVAINSDGTVTYTPNARFSGADSFTYTVSDGNGGFDTATVNVTVNRLNTNPVAQDDAVSTNEDTAVVVPVLVNDSDPDGDALAVSDVTQGANGGVAINADGTVTYTPNANFNGADSFDYTIADGNGGFATATATVTITGVNDAPVVDSQTVTVTEDSQDNALGLLAPSDVDGDPLTITVVTMPTLGNVTLVNGLGLEVGQQISVAELLGLQYDTALNATGPAGQFVYSVFDGAATVQGTVDLDITALNDPPLAQDDAVSTDEDTAVVVPVLVNDSDPDGDGLAVSDVTQGANGGVAINVDGTVTYTPNANFNGADSFTYTITDGNGGFDTATVNVTVDPVNDAPVAGADAIATDEDTAVIVPVLVNDGDPDGDGLAVSAVTQGANGGVAINADGTVTYTPNANFNGADSFTYTITDGNGGFDTATVNVTVDPVNNVPVLVNNNLSLNEGETAVVTVDNLSATDVDNPDPNLQFMVSEVMNGHFAQVANLGTGVTQFTQAQVVAGAVRFVHDGGETAPSYMVTVSDGTATTAPAAAAITFAGVNDAPEINLNGADGAVYIEQDLAVTVDADLTLADPDNTNLTSATVSIVGGPGNAGMEFLGVDVGTTGLTDIYDANTGVLTLTGTATLLQYEQVLRTVTYRNDDDDPTLGGARLQRTIRYVANDGVAASAAVLAVVDLTAINDAPVNTVPGAQSTAAAADLVLSGADGNALSIADPDAGGNDIQVTLSVANGVLTLASTAGLASATGAGTGTLILTGTLAAINAALATGVTYSPAAGFVGADTLTMATDDQGNTGSPGALSDTDTVAIAVGDQTGDVILQGLSLTVGDTGTGAFSLSNGDSLPLSTAIVGNTASGIGTLDVTGALTALNITAGTSLIVGGAGIGTMNINTGAAVTVGTPGSAAFMIIGDQATGIGTVTVSGADAVTATPSLLTVIGSGGLTVGNLGMGTLNVQSGAQATVSGDGTQVVVGDDGVGALNVSGGGGFTVDGLGGVFPGLIIGGTDISTGTGTGTVTVSGATSSLTLVGNTPFVEVGNLGTGTLNVDGGGSVTGATFLLIGRQPGGVGTLNLSGDTSSVTMSGVASAAAAAASPGTTAGQGAFLNVGPQGIGTLNIGTGADFLISVVEPLGASLGAGFNIGGGAGGGGTGTINVDGAGSTLRVSATRVFAGVGRDNVGDLNIVNGGSVELLGTAETTLIIGDDPGAVGTVTVDGADAITGAPSTLTVGTPTSVDGGIFVGGFDGGFGQLTVSGGATLNAFNLEAGRGATGSLSGVITITDPGTTVNLNNDFGIFSDPFQTEGGFLRAGRNAGDVGEIEILNQAVVNVTSNAGFSGAGIQIARNFGSQGALLIDNATLNVTDPGPVVGFGPFAAIGRGGDGRVAIRNGGAFNLSGEDVSVVVGRDAGATGTLDIYSGGSMTLDGGSTSAQLTIGTNQGSEGTVFVEGAGSSLTLTGTNSRIDIGQQGMGTLDIYMGGAVTVDGPFNTIANAGGSRGEVFVESGALFTVNGTLSVGNGFFDPATGFGQDLDGVGLLEIFGGTVTTQTLNIGDSARGVGTVIVGEGGILTDSNSLSVGNAGNGTLTVLDGTVTANGAFNNIADAGGSTGLVTVRGPGAQFNVNGELTVGNGFVDPATGFGTDGVPTSGRLELFGGGAANLANNLTVAADDADVTGSVLVSGISELGVANTIDIGTGAGAGSLTIQNGLDADEFVTSTTAVNLRASAINIGANGTLNLGKGSIHLPGAAAPGTLTNDGIVNLGQGPGIFAIAGNYTQTATGVLNLRLGEGGNGTAVFGTANFGATAPIVNLNRISGAGGARFGDTVALAAGAVIAGAGFDFSSVTINQSLTDGLDVHGQNVSFDVLPEAVQFTTVTTQTVINATGITGAPLIRGGGTDELIVADVTDSDISVSSAAGTESLLAINGDIIRNDLTVHRSINVSAEGNSVLALNRDIDADSINVGLGGAGTATLLIGSIGDAINLSSVIVGDTGTGLGEMFVHGFLETADLVIGNQAGSNGRVTVAGGAMDVTGLSTLIVGQQGTGELIVEHGGMVNNAGSLLIANGAGSTGTVTVRDDGSKLNVGNQLIVGNGASALAPGVPNGTLNILDGGSVTALSMNVGAQPNTTGTVALDGVGSRLAVGDPLAVGESIYVGVQGGTGTLTISGGALLEAFDLQAGRSFGDILNDNPTVAPGSGSDGTIVITDPGTLVRLSNDFGSFGAPFDNEGAFLRAGRNDGEIGRIEVLNQAHVEVTAAADKSAPGIQIARNPGSQGTLIVDNATVEIFQTGPATAFDGGPFFQAGRSGDGTVIIRNGGEISLDGDGSLVQVSRGNSDQGGTDALVGQGRLEIETGGKLIVESGANQDNANINVGQEANANGVIIVDGSADPLGTRSEILLSGGAAGQQAAFFNVGLNGTGALSILGGARVLIDGEAGDFPGMNIGGGPNDIGGDGTVLIDGAGSELAILGNTALLLVGRNGTGLLTVSGGANVNIIGGADSLSPNFDLGGALTAEGTAIVTGLGTAVTLQGQAGNWGGSLDVGRQGHGSLSILDRAVVSNDPNGISTIGREAGSVGTLIVGEAAAAGVAIFNAGAQLVIASDFDFAAVAPTGAGTGGTGTLTIGAFGQVNAGQVFIGTDGTLGGTGDLNATATMLDGGAIAAGFSAGTLNIGGDLTAVSGALEVELGGTGAGASDLILVSGAADLQGAQVEFSLIGGYQPLAGDGITILSAAGGATLDPSRLSLAMAGVAAGFSFDDFQVGITGTDLIFTADAPITAGNRAFFLGSDLDDIYAGGLGDDDLRGNGGDDSFTGGLGDDLIFGGAGNDTAVFVGSVSEFSILAGGTIVTDTNAADGDQGSDTLTGVEVLSFDDFTGTFAEFDAAIFGTPGDNPALAGTVGGDVIFGLAGDDTLSGGQGDDTLDGGTGGADRAVFAGNAIDFSVSQDATGAVTVTDQNLADGDDQGTDTLTNIEELVFDDLTVSVGAALAPITGTAGTDILSGTGGADLIFALGGPDIINGSAGADAIDGGAGIDTVNYSGGDRVKIDLSSGTADVRNVSTNTLEILDPATGDVTSVISSVGGFGDAMAVHPVTGTIYTSPGGGSSEILAIDPATGAITSLGDAGVGGISDLEFRNDGGVFELFGVTGRTTGSQLVKIDLDETTPGSPVLGAGSFVVGLTGVPDGLSGVAANAAGTIFASTVTSRDPTVSFLLTIDPASGAGTVIAPITDSVTGEQLVIGDLAIQPVSGVLYGVRGGSNISGVDPRPTQLFTINAATGQATLVGEIFDGAEARVFSSGLAFAADGTLYHQGLSRTFDTDSLANIENAIGSNGNDVLIGDDQNNFLEGLGGNDRLTGGLGNDIIDGGGGGGDRAFFAGSVNDFSVTTLSGVSTVVDNIGSLGTDTLMNVETLIFDDFVGSIAEVEAGIFGTSGADAALTGTAGGDLIFGLTGGDTIDGLAGIDDLRGGRGDDTLRGGDNTDTLNGGFGNDTLLGGLGDDTLIGGFGNDVLRGGAQADTLTGGPGADTFVFSPGDGGTAISLADVITDFVDGVDMIGLTGGLSFADLTIADDGFGSSVVSVPASGAVLVLVDGINPSLLDEADFTAIV